MKKMKDLRREKGEKRKRSTLYHGVYPRACPFSLPKEGVAVALWAGEDCCISAPTTIHFGFADC